MIFRDYLKPYDGLLGREETEWSNLWWDQANLNTSKRYLLIGDSTARMVRSTFAKMINYPVDMIGSSADVDDIMFVSLVDSFFATKQYRYDAIFLQIGHHGRVSKDGGPFTDNDLMRYLGGVRKLIKFLSQYTSVIIIESIFQSVIYNPSWFDKFGVRKILFKTGVLGYLTRIGLRKETKDIEINRVTDAKNVVLKELASELNLRWLDINTLVEEMKYAHTDHIHFEDKAKFFIANKMCNVIDKTKTI